MEVERIKQLESEMAQTYDPRQQAKILQEIINSKEEGVRYGKEKSTSCFI